MTVPIPPPARRGMPIPRRSSMLSLRRPLSQRMRHPPARSGCNGRAGDIDIAGAGGTRLARLRQAMESLPDKVDDLLVRVRRQALIIERLGTELHAVLIVLLQKKVLTIEDVRAAERRLDLAAEIARAREIIAVAHDLDELDAELDEGRDAA